MLREEVSPIPDEVLAADPSAQKSYGWLQLVMKQEILSSMLHAERTAVEKQIANLTSFYHNESEQKKGKGKVRAGSSKSTFRKARHSPPEGDSALILPLPAFARAPSRFGIGGIGGM